MGLDQSSLLLAPLTDQSHPYRPWPGKHHPASPFRHRRAQIQRPRRCGGEDAASDAQRAFGIRLPADERELLRLSPEIGAIGERLSFFPDSRLAAE
jgi:hypothetical protein